MAQYRKKPVVIEATQWWRNGDHPEDGNETFQDGPYKGEKYEGLVVRYFRRPDVDGNRSCEKCGDTMHCHGWIDTLEGGHIVCPGDWIITGVKGEFYPCKPDILAGVRLTAVLCPYCGSKARLVGGMTIYPHRPDLREKKFYQCEPCDAYVGCHPGTTNALGRLANAELRAAKMAAHAAFDPLWKSGTKKRSSAYAWLANALGMKKQKCHIGMFDVADCRRVVEACKGHNVGIEPPRSGRLE